MRPANKPEPRNLPSSPSWRFGCALGLIGISSGCGQPAATDRSTAAESKPLETTVVVYSALDQEFAEPVLKAYGAAGPASAFCPSSTSRAPRRSA